jgi:hypothetical protein
MDLPPKRRRIIPLATILVVCILLSLLLKFPDKIVHWAAPSTEGWVKFEVPRDAREIKSSVQKSREGLNICNADGVDWLEITVKVTGIYGAAYLIKPRPLKAGACEYLSFADFAEPSWKRMQMPPNQTVTRIELLVSYPAKGYASIEQK